MELVQLEISVVLQRISLLLRLPPAATLRGQRQCSVVLSQKHCALLLIDHADPAAVVCSQRDLEAKMVVQKALSADLLHAPLLG